MSGAASAKELLRRHNKEYYKAYVLNNATAPLELHAISSVPGVGASRRPDVYNKKITHTISQHHIKFITKNDHPQGFFWTTSAETLKKAARWGIVKTHSITGKVIGKLGQYRVAAHGRIAKGMISNSQELKLRLLDLFQDRFEALQAVESLVNKKNTFETYQKILDDYIQRLEDIKNSLEIYFDKVDTSGIDKTTFRQITADLDADISRTRSYLTSLTGKTSLHAHDNARGQHSILEFVKEQMIYGLYELQGINQDMTYSNKRFFALTRGELNDFIEDARKDIDDHEADLCNAVTEKHHGLYSSTASDAITYDFADDHLTPARERDVLLAISFIEGWDKVEMDEHGHFHVVNGSGKQALDTFAATKWKTHRNVIALLQSVGFYIFNIIKGVFVSTHPWEEETWKDKGFHLVAAGLRSHARPNEPLWRKPFNFFIQLGYAMVDIFNGVYDFGAGLVIRMPTDIISDWESSKKIIELNETLKAADRAILSIRRIEDARLHTVLGQCGERLLAYPLPASSQLASAEYALSGSEQNDILNAMARGLNGFGSFFSHNIYAKAPVAGLLFTAAYAVGAGAIYLPALTSSVFSAQYVSWFSDFAYSMGSSPFAAVIAGGSTQGQAIATMWDGLMHGPSGMAMSALYQCGEDPLTVGAYFAAAYGLGYILANGINGNPIPWLSEHLKEDLGTAPEAGYPLVGAKVAIMLYEGLLTEGVEHGAQHKLSIDRARLAALGNQNRDMLDRFWLVLWLSQNAAMLPKLEPRQKFAISQQIKRLFKKEDSASLNKLIYPEAPTSIAFQLISIPLSYVSAVLRCGASIFLSIAAGVSGQHQPMEPIKRAFISLFDKAKKDVSRLVLLSANTTYIAYIMLTTFVKMAAFLVTMSVGRVAGIFNAKPAHDMHKAMASVHAFFRRVGEFLYPVRLLKDGASAHPTHTMKEIESSYLTLIETLLPAPAVRQQSTRHDELTAAGHPLFTPPPNLPDVPLDLVAVNRTRSAVGAEVLRPLSV